MAICGAVRVVSGGPAPLVCNLESPHVGVDHGVRLHPAAPPYVTWPDGEHVVIPQAEFVSAERLAWRKGHVRREYQTLNMWKARQ